MTREERIETAARALFVHDVPGIFEESQWGDLSVSGRNEFRRVATAVVDALGLESHDSGSNG